MISLHRDDSQLKMATTNPKALPAVSRLGTLSMYPHASSISTISKTNRSKNNTQLLLIAATVKMTVRMNQAHRYIAKASGNWLFNCPVAGSV
jgi:hypothetical protein